MAGAALAVLAAGMAAYLAWMRRPRGTVWKVFLAEMGLCAYFAVLGLALALDLARLLPGWLTRLLGIAAGLTTLALLAALGLVLAHMRARPRESTPFGLVLGMRLENGGPNRDLLLRLNAAGRFARENPEARLVLSGGNAAEGRESEAGVMWTAMKLALIPEERLILEDQSRDTEENFRNTAALIGTDAAITVITSGYHVYRSLRLARASGFARVQAWAAPSPWATLPASLMAEWVCVLEGVFTKRFTL